MSTEPKFSRNGKLVFGSGIELMDETYAVQMSEAWVRIVAHNVLKRMEDGRCVISTEVRGKVYSVLQSIVNGGVQDLRNVFRTATVLADDGTWNIYALGSDANGLRMTEELLRRLLS